MLGAASTVNAVGSLLAAEALTLPGLTLTVLLAPVWSIAVGLTVVRDRLTAAPTAEEPLTDPRNLTRS